MFLNNKYTSWYYLIVKAAQSRVLPITQYRERHHIIPRCMGGTNDPMNLVSLTAKEHYIVHLLLPKMVEGRAKYKLQVALWRMCSPKDGRHIPCNRAYEQAKTDMATALSNLNKGKPLPEHQRLAMKGKPAHNKGKKMPASHGAKISAYRKGRKFTKVANSKPYESRKGQPCPKFKWVMRNLRTQEVETTTNLKIWCKSKSFSDVTFYKGRSEWIIEEKYLLRNNTRLI